MGLIFACLYALGTPILYLILLVPKARAGELYHEVPAHSNDAFYSEADGKYYQINTEYEDAEGESDRLNGMVGEL